MGTPVTEIIQWAISVLGPVAGQPRTAASVREGLGNLASRTKWLRYFQTLIWGTEQVIVGRSANQLEVTAHNLPSNTAVRVFATNGGTLSAPLAESTVYYVRVIDGDHIELSATSGPGAAITLTADGSGDQWISTLTPWISSLVISDASFGSGTLKDLVVWKAGTQTVSGAKTFADLTMSGTNKVKLAARAMTRMAGQHVIMGVVGTTIPTTVTNNASTSTVVIPIDPPHGSSVIALSVRVDPSAHANLPENMPKIGFYRKDNTEVDAVIQEFTDDSADAVEYVATHDIVLTLSSPHVVDRSAYNYFMYFTPEHGADSDPIPLRGAWYTLSTSAYDDGAG
jgi:hypothetical protein